MGDILETVKIIQKGWRHGDMVTEGRKAAIERIRLSDPDFYRRIGRKGAAARKTLYHHFQKLKEKDPEALKLISARGGRRNKKPNS